MNGYRISYAQSQCIRLQHALFHWDRFSDADGYGHETISAGINWYLLGNSTKVGFVFQRDDYEEAIGLNDTNTFRITSQIFF